MAMTPNGAAIRALRESLGWSGVKFAAAVGISHPHLFNIERGKRQASPPVLRKMADVLGVPLAAITSQRPVEEITDRPVSRAAA